MIRPLKACIFRTVLFYLCFYIFIPLLLLFQIYSFLCDFVSKCVFSLRKLWGKMYSQLNTRLFDEKYQIIILCMKICMIFFLLLFYSKKGFTDIGHYISPLKPWRTWRGVHLDSNETFMDLNPQPWIRKVMISSYFDH